VRIDDVEAFLRQILYSVNYRLRGYKCPHCGKQIVLANFKTKCCRRLI
jgi:hypothetical protein